MTRLITIGWESGDLGEQNVAFIGSPGQQYLVNSIVSSSPTPRTPGLYAVRVGVNNAGASAYMSIPLGGPKTEIWVRVGVYLPSNPGLSNTSEGTFIYFWDSAGSRQGDIRLGGSDLSLRAYGASQIASSGQATMGYDSWHTVEVHWLISGTTTGTCEVFLDGGRVINVQGNADTSNTTTLNVNNIGFGMFGGAAGSTQYIFDDIAVNDTLGSYNNSRIFDGRIVWLHPNGPGSNTQLTRGGTDSGANWGQVSEGVPSMAQYVQSSVVGQRDTYALQDLPAGSWFVNSVDAIAYGQLSDPTGGYLAPTIVSGATTNEGTAISLPVSPIYIRQQYEFDPNTSSAWTNAAVNAMEAGVTVR